MKKFTPLLPVVGILFLCANNAYAVEEDASRDTPRAAKRTRDMRESENSRSHGGLSDLKFSRLEATAREHHFKLEWLLQYMRRSHQIFGESMAHQAYTTYHAAKAQEVKIAKCKLEIAKLTGKVAALTERLERLESPAVASSSSSSRSAEPQGAKRQRITEEEASLDRRLSWGQAVFYETEARENPVSRELTAREKEAFAELRKSAERVVAEQRARGSQGLYDLASAASASLSASAGASDLSAAEPELPSRRPVAVPSMSRYPSERRSDRYPATPMLGYMGDMTSFMSMGTGFIAEAPPAPMGMEQFIGGVYPSMGRPPMLTAPLQGVAPDSVRSPAMVTVSAPPYPVLPIVAASNNQPASPSKP